MKYNLPLLLSTTLMLSACATITEKFNDGMAFLFDEPAAETEPSQEYAEPNDAATQQMRDVAQTRQVRQEEQNVNAFLLKEEGQQARAQDRSNHTVASNEPSVENMEAVNKVEKKHHVDEADHTEQPAKLEANQITAKNTSDSQVHEPKQQLAADNRHQHTAKQKQTQRRRKSNPSAAQPQSPSSTSESDEVQYVHRGYQDPLRNGFYPRQTHKRVVDYASQLAMELMDRAMGLNADELVGVTSFVRLNTSLTDTTILGNQLAEYLITELQAYGLGVIDFKVTDGINVTPRGDIAMSRSGERMAQSVQMDHILTGTMVEGPRGVRINARIVNVETKRVVASASIHIPAFVVTSLYAGQSIAP